MTAEHPPWTLTEGQEVELLAAARSARDRVVLALLLYTGLIPHEIPQLTVADVDVPSGTINVSGRHHGQVPIEPPLLRILEDYLSDPKRSASSPLIVGATGGSIPDRTIRHLVARTAARAGLSSVIRSPMELRRTFAWRVLRQTWDPEALRKRLRLSDVRLALLFLFPIGEKASQRMADRQSRKRGRPPYREQVHADWYRRIHHVGQTPEEVAQEDGAKVETVRKAVRRHRDRLEREGRLASS